MKQCENWLVAYYDNTVQQDQFDNWYIQSAIDYADLVIDYCPFCGNKLDENGCTKESD